MTIREFLRYVVDYEDVLVEVYDTDGDYQFAILLENRYGVRAIDIYECIVSAVKFGKDGFNAVISVIARDIKKGEYYHGKENY